MTSISAPAPAKKAAAKGRGTKSHQQPLTSLGYALKYAKRGIRVIWIPARSKAPVVKDWPSLATTDAATIRRWAAEHPGCNFGLVMGDGFIAIDFDAPSKYAELRARGLNLPPTLLHRTAKGLHAIYRVPKDVVIKNSVRPFPGIDVRHKGAQIVAPGSVHPSGAVYKVARDFPIADLPEESLRMLMEPQQKATAAVTNEKDEIPEGARNSRLTSIAGTLRKHGKSPEEIEAELHRINSEQCDPPLPDVEITSIVKSAKKWAIPADVQATLNDERPKVLLPADNVLMSEVAKQLGELLADKLYHHANEVKAIIDGKLCPVSVQSFRTFVERHAVCCRLKSANRITIEVGVTMGVEDARGILASQHFREKLRQLKRINSCRLPVRRADGTIELLPEGYDEESQTLTISNVQYADDMTFEDGLAVLKDLFGEFNFADGPRSEAVAVSALLGLYGAQLPPADALRPVFLYSKNAEGAGATMCATCAIVPVLGYLHTESKPEDDAEMRKTLITAIRYGSPVLMLDNVKGHLNFPSLEAFASAESFGGRALSVNENISGPNVTTIFITGNGVTITPDLRRRTLFIELHLEEERAENRVFKRDLKVSVLKTMTPNILAACWSLVRYWDAQGRPKPSRSHTHCSEWASVIGGIVQAAGYVCPLDEAAVAIVADEDGDYMRTLVEAMAAAKVEVKKAAKKDAYQNYELVALCRSLGIFPNLVGEPSVKMSPAQTSAFGKMLGRYNNRQVGSFKFIITGKNHSRRYQIGAGSQGQAGYLPQEAETAKTSTRGDHPAAPCDPAPLPSGMQRKDRKFTREHRAAQRAAARKSAPNKSAREG